MKKNIIVLIVLSILFQTYTFVSLILMHFNLFLKGGWHFVSAATSAIALVLIIIAYIIGRRKI